MNIQDLETKYLKAKVAYYEGHPIMSDAAFDELENVLKTKNSKVVNQVGAKRKDFDFPHPSPMKSLAKIQTARESGKTNYQHNLFNDWLTKRSSLVKETIQEILYSPKFDGSAINIVYRNGKLESVLTRGDGKFGKDATDRFKKHLPATISIYPTEVVEIRCEAVMAKDVFAKKYAAEFANARNIVAGIIGKDDIDVQKVADLTLMPIHLLVNGSHKNINEFKAVSSGYPIFPNSYQIGVVPATVKSYVDIIRYWEDNRESFNFQLDGVVIALDPKYREKLGENDHDPEWALAIKFVPDEVVSKFSGIEWNVGKTGELTPVVLMEPVQLAGTTVKRASGYNAGYIFENHIGPGASFTIAKAGDIIPEIQDIIIPSTTTVKLPKYCPSCFSDLSFDGIHLMCTNDKCTGKIAKKLASAADAIDLKGVGGKTLEPFAKAFKNLFQVIKYVRQHGLEPQIAQFGIQYKSRSHEIFYLAFANIKSLTYDQVIVMLGYDNVGKKLAFQVAKEFCGQTPDYSGHDRSLVALLHRPDVVTYIKTAISELEALGIVIDKPKEIVRTGNTVFACLTGSPKIFGYESKDVFLKNHPDIVEVSITDKNCQLLITDSLTSTSNKMQIATKKGIPIKTYNL